MAPGHRKADASRATAAATKKSAAKKRPVAAKTQRPAVKKKSAGRPAGTKVKWKADPRGTAPEAQRPVEPAPEPPRTPPPLPVPIATFIL